MREAHILETVATKHSLLPFCPFHLSIKSNLSSLYTSHPNPNNPSPGPKPYPNPNPNPHSYPNPKP